MSKGSLSEKELLKEIFKTRRVRVAVRSVCIDGDRILVERHANDISACYAFPGGALEPGDSFEDRIRKEYEEEIGEEISYLKYLFVVENRFMVDDTLCHCVEIYYETRLNNTEIKSKEPHLEHKWIRIDELKNYDIRPVVVRDVIADGKMYDVNHLSSMF
ncbi:MAG: NUDIX domain-containing protein [Ignavibacteriae bacterium]|nr:MAG: NUDIX domain-containing protein [Ignavibacteriota bacterium]